jgi:hypothetical protein
MTQLRTRLNDQSATVEDVRYQQVLNNLAMIIVEPGKLPYFCDPQTARTTITDTASVNDGLGWSLITAAPAGVLGLFDRFLFTSQSSLLTATQTKAGEWDAVCVNDPDKLQWMRAVYRRVAGNSSDEDEQLFVGNYFDHFKVTGEVLRTLEMDAQFPRDILYALGDLSEIDYSTEKDFLADLQKALKARISCPKPKQGDAARSAQPQQVATFEPIAASLSQSSDSSEDVAANANKDGGKQKGGTTGETNDATAGNRDVGVPLCVKARIAPYWFHIMLTARSTDMGTLLSRPFVGDDQLLRRTYLPALQPGWYGVGHRRDVPRNAEYVGRYGKTYVWVLPENMDQLSRLTLAMLDLETVATNRRPPGLVPSVR